MQMTKHILFIILLSVSFAVKGQNDTSAYQTQRLKINELLSQRSIKFGQYEQSLNERTGIFGFQTKDDIRNSNEILREITLNDNNIFKELKILMDYKDLQVKEVQNNITSNKERLQSYMMAIKKLQDQNQVLREEVRKQESATDFAWYIITFLVLVLAGGSYFFYRKLKIS